MVANKNIDGRGSTVKMYLRHKGFGVEGGKVGNCPSRKKWGKGILMLEGHCELTSGFGMRQRCVVDSSRVH